MLLKISKKTQKNRKKTSVKLPFVKRQSNSLNKTAKKCEMYIIHFQKHHTLKQKEVAGKLHPLS